MAITIHMFRNNHYLAKVFYLSWPDETIAIEVNHMVRRICKPYFGFPCNIGNVPLELFCIWERSMEGLI